MSATPQEDAPHSKIDSDAPRFSRRVLLKGAGGLVGLGVLGAAGAARYIWHERQPLYNLSGHTNLVVCVAFSPDGATLADASYDGTVRLWRVSDGQLLHTLGSSHGPIFRALAFAPDGETVMAGGSSSGNDTDGISIWRVGDGTPVQQIAKTNDASAPAPGESEFIGVNSVAYAPDGALIASGTLSGRVYLWRASDGQFVRKMIVSKSVAAEVGYVAFSPDGRIVAAGLRDVTGRSTQAVQLWQVGDGTLLNTLDVEGAGVTGVSFSPDGQTLLAGSASLQQDEDERVYLWRVSDGERIRTLRVPATAVVFAPDGQTFATAHGRDVQVRRLDGTVVHSVAAGGTFVGDIAFSPDGRLLAAATDSPKVVAVQVWRLR